MDLSLSLSTKLMPNTQNRFKIVTASIWVADIQWSPGMYKTKYQEIVLIQYILDLPGHPGCQSVTTRILMFFLWGSEYTFMCDCCWVGDRSKIHYVPINWCRIELPSTVWIPYSFSQVRIISLHFKRNDSWVHANKKILPPNIFLSLQWKTTGAYPVITNIASEK